MALTRLGPNQSVNLASNVTGTLPSANLPTGTVIQVVGDENAVVSDYTGTEGTEYDITESGTWET